MDFLIASAIAQDGAAPPEFALGQLIPFILIIVIFWFLLIRPQMKRNKQHREMVSALSAGDEVITTGGMLGKITHVGDSFVTVKLADALEIKVQKHAVAQVVPKGTIESAS